MSDTHEPKPTARRAALFGIIISLTFFISALALYSIVPLSYNLEYKSESFSKSTYGLLEKLDPLIFFIIDSLDSGRAWDIVILAILPLGTALILLTRMRFLRPETLFFWRNISRERPSKSSVALLLFRVAVLPLIIAAPFLIAYIVDNYIECSLTSISHTAEGLISRCMSTESYLMLFGFFNILMISILVYIFAAIAYAVYTSGEWPVIRRVSKAGLYGIIGLAFVAGSFYGYQYVVATSSGLSKVDGISTSAEPGTVFIIGGVGREYQLDDEYSSSVGSPGVFYNPVGFGFNRQTVPFSNDNENRLRGYLDEFHIFELNKWSAQFYIRENRLRNLDLEGANRFDMMLYEETGDLNHSARIIHRLRNAAATEENIRLLDRLAYDEDVLYRGFMAHVISKCYERFGDPDKAWFWYETCVKSIPARHFANDDNYRQAYFKPPVIEHFITGTIRGRILVEGKPDKDIRVGVLKKTPSTDEFFEDTDFYLYIFSSFDAEDMAAASGPGDNGEFEFTGLPGGEYVVVVSVADRPGMKHVIEERVPAVQTRIIIDEQQPVADIGTVNFVFVKGKTITEIQNEKIAERKRQENIRAEEMNKKGRTKKNKI